MSIIIPADLLPAAGRFGCGPASGPPDALDALAARAAALVGERARAWAVQARFLPTAVVAHQAFRADGAAAPTPSLGGGPPERPAHAPPPSGPPTAASAAARRRCAPRPSSPWPAAAPPSW